MKGMGFAELNREEIAAKFYRFAGGRLPAITGPFHELQVGPTSANLLHGICNCRRATIGSERKHGRIIDRLSLAVT